MGSVKLGPSSALPFNRGSPPNIPPAGHTSPGRRGSNAPGHALQRPYPQSKSAMDVDVSQLLAQAEGLLQAQDDAEALAGVEAARTVFAEQPHGIVLFPVSIRLQRVLQNGACRAPVSCGITAHGSMGGSGGAVNLQVLLTFAKHKTAALRKLGLQAAAAIGYQAPDGASTQLALLYLKAGQHKYARAGAHPICYEACVE